MPLTGLTGGQVRTFCTLVEYGLQPRSGRLWGLPLPVRVLLVLIHLRTILTRRALAALFHTSHSSVAGSSPLGAGARSHSATRRGQETLRQHRRRGDAINHTSKIIAGLWNLKNCHTS